MCRSWLAPLREAPAARRAFRSAPGSAGIRRPGPSRESRVFHDTRDTASAAPQVGLRLTVHVLRVEGDLLEAQGADDVYHAHHLSVGQALLGGDFYRVSAAG